MKVYNGHFLRYINRYELQKGGIIHTLIVCDLIILTLHDFIFTEIFL